jgi:hypothetical protein
MRLTAHPGMTTVTFGTLVQRSDHAQMPYFIGAKFWLLNGGSLGR